MNETARERARCRKYGMEKGQYATMAIAQRDKCAICGRKSRRLEVDHDHKTGQVRSLLCHNCNCFLAVVEDRADVANRYLDLWKAIAKFANI